jgi:hypothetical protein
MSRPSLEKFIEIDSQNILSLFMKRTTQGASYTRCNTIIAQVALHIINALSY